MTLVAILACGISVQALEKADVTIERAETLLNDGRAAEAATLLETYVRAQPGDSRGYVLLGRAYAEMSQLDNAAKSLRRAVALSPRSLAAHLDLGVVEVTRGNKENGKKEFQLALAIDPDQREALYNLGRLTFDEKDFASAARYFTQCVYLSPSDVDALSYLLRCAIAGNHAVQVAEIHKKLTRLLPPKAEAHLEIGQWLVGGRFYGEAEMEFAEALALSPGSAAVRYNYAALCLSRGVPQKALQLLVPLGAREEKDARYHYLLGQCYEHVPDAQRAVLEYKRATKLDPDQEAYYISLAAVVAAYRGYDAAESILSGAARRLPKSLRVQVGIGLIQLESGNAESAKAAYEQATQLAPRSPLCLNLLGRIQMAQGQYDEAIQTFGEALRRDPSEAQAFFLMGLSYTKLPDKSEEALQAFRQAVLLNPDLADGYFWIGSVYFYRKGQYAEAAQYLEETLKRAPQWGAAYQLLIQSYRRMGDDAKAADTAQRFRKVGRIERPQLDFGMLLNQQ